MMDLEKATSLRPNDPGKRLIYLLFFVDVKTRKAHLYFIQACQYMVAGKYTTALNDIEKVINTLNNRLLN